MLVDPDGYIVGEARHALVPQFPRPRWVELDPMALWDAQLRSIRDVMDKDGVTANDLAAVGVTTHRETCLIWERRTGLRCIRR